MLHSRIASGTGSKKLITHRVLFSSLSECATWAGDTTKPRWDSKQSLKEGPEREEFTGTASFDDALKLVRYGWTEGRSKLVKGVEGLALKKELIDVPSFTFDVAGARPEVPLAIAGDPCCMWDCNPLQETKAPVLRFVIDVTGNCGWSTQSFMNYDSAILSVIDSLEANNRCSVELTAAITISDRKETRRQEFLIKLKEAGQHVDFDVMAFAIAHPSMLRRIGFGCMERIVEDSMEDRMSDGYGVPAELDPTTLDGAYHVPGLQFCKIPSKFLSNSSFSKELFEAVLNGFNNLVDGKTFTGLPIK